MTPCKGKTAILVLLLALVRVPTAAQGLLAEINNQQCGGTLHTETVNSSSRDGLDLRITRPYENGYTGNEFSFTFYSSCNMAIEAISLSITGDCTMHLLLITKHDRTTRRVVSKFGVQNCSTAGYCPVTFSPSKTSPVYLSTDAEGQYCQGTEVKFTLAPVSSDAPCKILSKPKKSQLYVEATLHLTDVHDDCKCLDTCTKAGVTCTHSPLGLLECPINIEPPTDSNPHSEASPTVTVHLHGSVSKPAKPDNTAATSPTLESTRRALILVSCTLFVVVILLAITAYKLGSRKQCSSNHATDGSGRWVAEQASYEVGKRASTRTEGTAARSVPVLPNIYDEPALQRGKPPSASRPSIYHSVATQSHNHTRPSRATLSGHSRLQLSLSNYLVPSDE